MTEQNRIVEYWQGFYSAPAQRELPMLPSQFAVFVAGETPQPSLVIDVGCGNGRDSFLFARHGHAVLGIDAAQAAIASCQASQQRSGLDASFLCADICSHDTLAQLTPQLRQPQAGAVLVYSRFFLHAVPEPGQSALLALALALAAHGPTRLAVEFRTVRDAALPKRAASHYRRFIDPEELMSQAGKLGFKTDYFVQGIGYAKHGPEDAHVARCIFST
jgi:SAM-dependent methyltransferase